MIKLAIPHLPAWKVVPKNIVQLLDTVHTVKHKTRCPSTLASVVRALACVDQAYAFGVVVPQLSVSFKSNWEYADAIVELGDDFDPLPCEW